MATTNNTIKVIFTATAASAIGAITNIANAFNKARTAAQALQNATARLGAIRAPAGLQNFNPFANANQILTAGNNAVQTVTNGLTGSLTKIGKFTTDVSKLFLGLNDGVRVMAQGITNLGRALFFFVTIPIVGFLSKAGRTAIDFNDAMIRVQKTTGIWTENLENPNETIGVLTENLRKLATQTASSHVEIAGIAEVVGQLGVSNVGAITNLTTIFEMMGQTVGMTGETVAQEMGQIANAFDWNLNASSDSVFRLANVINMLENTTASSASQIITSLQKWAQAAHAMNISAAEASALSATMVSLGLSEEEAGTALKRMSTQLPKNAERIAQLMGANEKYSSAQAVMNALNEDAVGVFLDIADAAKAAKDAGQNAEALYSLIYAADERGGRALLGLASNTDMVRQNIANANAEWERAVSMVNEYNRAMSSTKSHLAVFKNNVNDVAITIGDALLPVINRVAVILIPALQSMSAWFKSLSDKQKLMTIGFVAAALAAGPLIMLFGQLAHGVNLILMGFGLFGKILPTLISGIVPIISFVGRVAAAFLSWPGAIALAVVGVLKILSELGVDVAGFFSDIATKAAAWGAQLMGTYANGLAVGANAVLKVISWIANLIASFFEAHSPPEAGPLASIDKWGGKLLQTYLKGFQNADFSILDDVGRMIEQSLTRGKKDDAMNAAIEQYAKARVILSQMLSKHSQTGVIDEGLMDEALSGMGEMKEDVATLIRLQLTYNNLQLQLENIEKRRRGILDTYDREIAAVGLSNAGIEDKVANIRKSMRTRDQEIGKLNKEEKALKDQSDAAKDQLDFQKNMVNAMMQQEDILARITEAIDKVAKGLGDVAGALGGFEFPETPETEDVTANLQEATEEVMSFIDRISEGKESLAGFTDGFNGLPEKSKDAFSSEEAYNYYKMLYDIGTRADTIRDKFIEISEKVDIWKTRLSTVWEEIKKIDLGKLFDFSNVKIELPKIKLSELPVVGDFIAGFSAVFSPKLLEDLKAAFADLGKAVQEVLAFLGAPESSTFKTVLGGILKFVGLLIGALAGGLVDALIWIVTNLVKFQTGLMRTGIAFWTFVKQVITGIGGLKNVFGALLGAWSAIFTKAKSNAIMVWQSIFTILKMIWNNALNNAKMVWENVFTVIKTVWEKAKTNAAELWEMVITIITTAWTRIKDAVAAKVVEVIETVRTKWAEIKDAVTTKVTEVQTELEKIWTNISDKVTEIWDAITAKIAEVWLSIYTNVTTKVEEILTILGQKWDDIKSKIETTWDAIVKAVTDKVQEVYDIVTDKVQEVLDWFEEKVEVFKDWGGNLIQGFIDGITEKAKEIVTVITGAVELAIDAAKKALGIESPSVVFNEIGQNTIDGFNEGVYNNPTGGPSGFRTNTTGLVGGSARGASGEAVIINLNFGKDSVRSDEDIRRIAAEVERIISKKTQNRLGYNFGG